MPALDVLWRYQDGLVNIIECMPDDLWEEVEVQDDFTISLILVCHCIIAVLSETVTPRSPQTVKRDIHPDDWPRFLVYAPRIRELNLHFKCKPLESAFIPTSADVFTALARAAPSRPLLPNLRYLVRYSVTAVACTPSHDLLLGSALTELYLEWVDPCDVEDIESLLAHVRDHCVNLQKMVILYEGEEWPSTGLSSFAQPGALSWPKMIRSLSVCPRTPLAAAALKDLQLLPRLTDLELRIRSGGTETTPSYQPSSLPRPEFRLLERLNLQATVTAECARVLAMFSFPVLEEFGMVARICDVGLLKPLSQTIHDHCSHESLHSLYSQSFNGEDDESHTGEPHITAHDLQPLYAFRCLERFKLDTLQTIYLTDSDLYDMASSWRFLKHLVLLPDLRSRLPSPPILPSRSATLAGLLHFAKLCPSLHALYIGVDTLHPQASFTKILKALPEAVQPESTLRFLALGCCEPVGHPPTVASCLAMTFKNLRAFVGGHPYAEVSDDDEPLSMESWEEVEEHLPLCARKS